MLDIGAGYWRRVLDASPGTPGVLMNRGDGPDKILDIGSPRALDGFDITEAVMPLAARQCLAVGYKKVAGMDLKALNARAQIRAKIQAQIVAL